MIVEDVVSIKLNNIKHLISEIRFCDSLTKKEIAERTRLSNATITNLCNELALKGIVSEGARSSEIRVGRTPSPVQFNYGSFYVLALDFQLDDVVGVAILNLRNEVLFTDEIRIPQEYDVPDIVRLAKDRLITPVTGMQIEDKIIGVGASVPAVYDRNDGLIKSSSIPRYLNTPLRQLLKDTFQIPAFVDNCANIRAVSAYAQCPSGNIVCLDVSQGVGCGVVIDGDVLRGKSGYATEIAHIPIGNPEHICPYCGSRGCVETDLGVEAIISHFPEINAADPLPVRWKKCVSLFRESNGQYADYLHHIGSLLGQVASILINLFDPEHFYVTGYISDLFDLIEEGFRSEINTRSYDSMKYNLNLTVKENEWNDVYIGISDALYHRWIP